jgi:RNA polymerase sigma-70 factor (ECF subfamily)
VTAAESASVKGEGRIAEERVGDAVRAVLAGDPHAFSIIVEAFQDSIMTIALTLKMNAHAAEELTQDVFVRAYVRLASFDAARPMKPWLAKIACRLAQDEWRNRRKEAMRMSSARDQAEEAGSDSDPLQLLVADERARRLWRAVEKISPAERTAVILYYREGLSVDEVAEATGVSAGTVKTLLFRARDHLKALLHDV